MKVSRLFFAVFRISGVLLIDMTTIKLNNKLISGGVISVAKYF